MPASMQTSGRTDRAGADTESTRAPAGAEPPDGANDRLVAEAIERGLPSDLTEQHGSFAMEAFLAQTAVDDARLADELRGIVSRDSTSDWQGEVQREVP